MVGTNPEAEAHRQHKRIRARAAAQPRGYLLDLDTLWGTGATPNTYRREYYWGDQMYPNDAARAAIARVLVRCCGRSSPAVAAGHAAPARRGARRPKLLIDTLHPPSDPEPETPLTRDLVPHESSCGSK